MTRPPAAGRHGFFPGDDLSEMPSGGQQIQWLKISRISGYRDISTTQRPASSHNLLTGRTYKDPYTRATWAELTRSLTEEGFREPLKLEYEPDSRRAYLGEGNHRLVAARLAGYSAVPVWALRGLRQRADAPGQAGTRRTGTHAGTTDVATSRPASGRPMCSPQLPLPGREPAILQPVQPGIPARHGRLSTSPGSIRRNGDGPGSVTPACARPTRTWPRGPPRAGRGHKPEHRLMAVAATRPGYRNRVRPCRAATAS